MSYEDAERSEFVGPFQVELQEPAPIDVFQIYNTQVESLPEFDRSATTELGKRIVTGREASSLIIRAALEGEPLTDDEYANREAQSESGFEARDQVVAGHLSMVLSMAREYLPVDSPVLPDLIQRGNLELVQAVMHHDWQAEDYTGSPQIRQRFEEALIQSSTSFGLDLATQKELIKLQKVEDRLEKQGIDPTDEALAEQLSWSVDLIKSLRTIRTEIMTSSLAEPLDSSEFDTLGDRIANQQADQDAIPARSTETQRLMKLFESITDGADLTLEEIRILVETLVEESSVPETAIKLGIPQTRVAQTKERAIRKIRDAFSDHQEAA